MKRREKSVSEGCWAAVLVVILGYVVFTAPGWTQVTEEEGGRASEKAGDQEPVRGYAEEVQVVAAPILEEERLTPFATLVTSVSARQVEDLGAGDLAAALRRVPGVTISRYNLVGAYGGGDGGAVYVRGHGSGRPGAEISTLVDGIPRFVGVWTHPLLDTLSADAAGEIEVLKSAQPVLFGNMAFAGVNLVSKRALGEGSSTRVQGGFGEHTTTTGLLEHGARRGAWDYYLLASQRQSDGHRSAAGGRVRSFFARLGYQFGAGWEANLQLHSADAWADDPGRVGGAARGLVPRFAVRDALAITTVQRQRGNHLGNLKVYRHQGDIHWRQWDFSQRHGLTTVTDFTASGVRLREHLRLAAGTEMIVGVDHDRYGGSTTERRPTTSLVFPRLLLRNTSVFAMAARTFGSTVEVTPSLGVRWTDTAHFGEHWGGQAGVVLRRGGWEVHGNWARAVNLPGVWTAVFFQRWGRGEAWRGLDPEVVRHGEVGVGQRLGEEVRLRVVAFADRVTDALRFVPVPPPPVFTNLGRYTLRGVEGSVSFTPNPHLAAFTGMTYLDPEPANVPNAPEWALVGGVSWLAAQRLRVQVDAQWVDSQTVLNPRYATTQAQIGSYSLVNIKTAWRVVTLARGGAEVFVTGENLLGEEYEYRPGYPAPGRVVTAGVELKW